MHEELTVQVECFKAFLLMYMCMQMHCLSLSADNTLTVSNKTFNINNQMGKSNMIWCKVKVKPKGWGSPGSQQQQCKTPLCPCTSETSGSLKGEVNNCSGVPPPPLFCGERKHTRRPVCTPACHSACEHMSIKREAAADAETQSQRQTGLHQEDCVFTPWTSWIIISPGLLW